VVCRHSGYVWIPDFGNAFNRAQAGRSFAAGIMTRWSGKEFHFNAVINIPWKHTRNAVVAFGAVWLKTIGGKLEAARHAEF
jgi:hypothetical protein